MNKYGCHTNEHRGYGNGEKNQAHFNEVCPLLEQVCHREYDADGEEKMVVGPKIKRCEKTDGDEMPQSENWRGKAPFGEEPNI